MSRLLELCGSGPLGVALGELGWEVVSVDDIESWDFSTYPIGALRLSGDGGAFPSFILAGGDDRRLLPAARLPLRARARPEVDLQLQRSPLRCGKISFSSPGEYIGVTTTPSYFVSSAPLRIVDFGSRPLSASLFSATGIQNTCSSR